MKIKVFTAFSGYDSQCMALDKLGLDYELVGWSEIDRFAIQAHNAIFPQWEKRNFGDISKIDWNTVPEFDLFTYSSPCQDFSIAGLKKGGKAGSGTRSSLLWECRRAIELKRPKYLLLENVKALVGKSFLPLFNEWIKLLESLGYSSRWAVLNAKDYGVPQSRERVFLISTLDEKDLCFFPKPFKLDRRLKDVLENDVEEKYYYSGENIDDFIKNIKSKRSREGIIQLGNITDDTNKKFKNPQTGRNYSVEGLCPTLNTCGGGKREPKIVEPICLNSKINGVQPSLSDRIYSTEGISTCVTTCFRPNIKILNRVRKLTPRECFRLMGVDENQCLAQEPGRYS